MGVWKDMFSKDFKSSTGEFPFMVKFRKISVNPQVSLLASLCGGQKALGQSLNLTTSRTNGYFVLKGIILLCFPNKNSFPLLPPKAMLTCEKYSGCMGSTLLGRSLG